MWAGRPPTAPPMGPGLGQSRSAVRSCCYPPSRDSRLRVGSEAGVGPRVAAGPGSGQEHAWPQGLEQGWGWARRVGPQVPEQGQRYPPEAGDSSWEGHMRSASKPWARALRPCQLRCDLSQPETGPSWRRCPRGLSAHGLDDSLPAALPGAGLPAPARISGAENRGTCLPASWQSG